MKKEKKVTDLCIVIRDLSSQLGSGLCAAGHHLKQLRLVGEPYRRS